MQNNAPTSRGRESDGSLKAGHLKTRAILGRPEQQKTGAGRKGFSDKLAQDRAFVAEPTD